MTKAHPEPEPRETQHRDNTKSAAAYEVWDKALKADAKTPRHKMIEMAMTVADMTPASASTIYQQYRSERGMVNHPED